MQKQQFWIFDSKLLFYFWKCGIMISWIMYIHISVDMLCWDFLHHKNGFDITTYIRAEYNVVHDIGMDHLSV